MFPPPLLPLPIPSLKLRRGYGDSLQQRVFSARVRVRNRVRVKAEAEAKAGVVVEIEVGIEGAAGIAVSGYTF